MRGLRPAAQTAPGSAPSLFQTTTPGRSPQSGV